MDKLYDNAINIGDTLLYVGGSDVIYSFIVSEKRQGWLFVNPCEIFRKFHSPIFHKYVEDLVRLYKVKEVLE
jgi:hypothetical protein